ncbi:MAG: hypothetical protein Q8O33_12220 [Pseudomonadota bacterium]|nr:hypothetical protein [Pseudomonadota bacterium]
MIRLDLWLTLQTGERLQAGELACGDADSQGRYASAFRYTPDYFDDPRAFPLDPANLPLTPGDTPGPDGLAALGRKWGVSGAAGICEEVARFVSDIDRRLTRPP